jgi:hypothetical protein
MSALLDLAKNPVDLTLPRFWRALAPADREGALRVCLANDKASRAQWVQFAATLPRFRAFRPKAVAALTDEQLASAIGNTTSLPPDVIQTALIGMHLPAKADMLGAFLEALGIPHKDGLIADGATVKVPEDRKQLESAVLGLTKSYPPREVVIYMLALLAMDPETWQPLAAVLPKAAEGVDG